MYKTSTFLTSLFCKFRVTDKNIRKEIILIYGPLIDSILHYTTPAKRILLFRELLPVMKITIEYLEKQKEKPSESYKESSIALQSLASFAAHLVNKITTSDGSFENIMKQVNIDDIACDIGECITSIKKDPIGSTDSLARLDVLLIDYNMVTGCNLTSEGLLSSPGADELEL